jgi:hypothetical protein
MVKTLKLAIYLFLEFWLQIWFQKYYISSNGPQFLINKHKNRGRFLFTFPGLVRAWGVSCQIEGGELHCHTVQNFLELSGKGWSKILYLLQSGLAICELPLLLPTLLPRGPTLKTWHNNKLNSESADKEARIPGQSRISAYTICTWLTRTTVLLTWFPKQQYSGFLSLQAPIHSGMDAALRSKWDKNTKRNLVTYGILHSN